MAGRIEDYAMIGDGLTAALVGRDGSLDWLCWPRFDSDACFAALLGTPENGRWLLEPRQGQVRRTRRYRGDSLILETDLETADGAATMTDFMPVGCGASSIVRMVTGRRGHLPFRCELILQFGYGRDVPWVCPCDDGALCAIAGPHMVVLRGNVPLRVKDHRIIAEFEVMEGQTVALMLTYGPSSGSLPPAFTISGALARTERFWRDWSSIYHRQGEWAAEVTRSLVTLKGLIYAPTGGIAAAVTAALPEHPGGIRNWDYRYCWLRDSTFVLLTLINAGYGEEAIAWRDWLLRAAAGNPAQLQVLYGLAGERRLWEWNADWLTGFENSTPVRFGNAAAEQMQTDIYGEIIDALYHGRKGGMPEDGTDWALQRSLLDHLEQIWRLPDEGIWEVRNGPHDFTHSKVMAWVAFDRAVKTVEEFAIEGPLDRWRAVRDEIHRDVCRRGFSKRLGSFVRDYASEDLDASLLLVPLVGFLPASDPRVSGTLAAVERHLMGDGLVRRYDPEATKDGLPGPEGYFIPCSFWYVDNLIMAGRIDEAKSMFRRLLDLRNDLGLLSEEYDPIHKRQLGNFPQALSHIALITTAANLAQSQKPAEQRSGRSVETPKG